MTNSLSPEEQREIIKKIEKEPFVIGEKVCPISISWLDSWKNYVNYNNDEDDTITTQVDPIDNSKIIVNGQLSPNSKENEDYDLIHKLSYDYLQKWFSGDSTVEIEVIPDSKGQPVVPTKYDVYKIFYISSEKVIEAHKYTKVSEIHHKAREMFDIPESSTTRLVNYFNSYATFVYKDDKFLQNYPISKTHENKLLLDYQKEDQSWYSDEIKLQYKMKKENNINNNYLQSSSFNSYNSSYNSQYSSAGSAGVVGFYNLGNTCYFNSGTQCLLHTVPFIAKLISNDDWMNDLNVTNKIGMKGELANSFALLAKDVWSGKFGTLNPSNLKSVIGRFRDNFSGFDQQDSHELIYAMLDGIHEDLNRVRIKPTNIESFEGDGTDDDLIANKVWDQYRQINDSIVVDIFDGLFKSRLLCPNCNSTTVVFDPFRSITMPIERPHIKYIKTIYVPFDFAEKRRTFTLEIHESNAKDINEIASVQVSRIIRKEVKVIVGAQINKKIPVQFSFHAISFNNASVYAFEIPNVSYNDREPLFATCMIGISPKVNIPAVLNLVDKMLIPFIVDVSDLSDDFDEDEEKVQFEKKIEERLHVLWENDDSNDYLKDNEKERQRKEKEKKLKEEEKNKKEKTGDDSKQEKTEDEIKQEEEKKEKTEDEIKQEEEKKEKTEDNIKQDKEGQEKKEETKNKEENSYIQYQYHRFNSMEQIFKRKVNLAPPENVNFSDPSQKLTVSFKKISIFYDCQNNQKIFTKMRSKNSPYFIGTLTNVHLNENTKLSIKSLFLNLETKSNNDNQEDSDKLTLSKCFNFFSTPDVLDDKNQWYCPKCKQFVCAEKKLDIWKVPQILIIQLKRFYGSGFGARKLDYFVDFPEILDLKNYVIGPQKNEEELKYRLYAVSNQYGSLSGGHYTADARVRDPREAENDKGWYKFDDSHVSRSSEFSAHSAAAYVLFYERIQ